FEFRFTAGWLVTTPSCPTGGQSANRARRPPGRGHGIPPGHRAEPPGGAGQPPGLLPGQPGLVRPAHVGDQAEPLGLVSDVRWPDETRLTGKQTGRLTGTARRLGSMARRNPVAAARRAARAIR